MSGASVRGRVAVAGLHGIGLSLLALQAYVRTLPPTADAIPAADSAEAAWWGLWPVTYVPAAWFWSGIALVVALMAWGWWSLLRRPSSATRPHPAPSLLGEGTGAPVDDDPVPPLTWRRLGGSYPWLLPALSLGLLAAFFAFPIVHTRWGDAYILSRTIAWPNPDLRLTHSWQAPLDVWLHSQVWLWGHARFNWDTAIPVYRLLSPVAGLLYLVALLGLSRERDLAPPWLLYGLGASLGLMQLFFGYIENYSFVVAGILAFLWVGYSVIKGHAPLWLAALVLGITNATHPSTVILAPALLYLLWVRLSTPPPGTTARLRVVLAAVGPMALAAAATVLLMESGGHGIRALLTTDRPGGGDASWFVPLFETRTRWESYTLLSWLHVRDLLNQQLLVAPVVLPSLLWLALWRRGSKQPAATTQTVAVSLRFFTVAAVGHLLLIAVWNPDYGGQRDWDLFSLHAVTTFVWLGAQARQILRDNRLLAAGFAPLIVLQALQTAAFVYQNTLPWEWPS